MERIFFRERRASMPDSGQMERKRLLNRSKNKKYTIAVVGVSRGAGTTFVATSLAFLLSNFVEKGRKDVGEGETDKMGGGRHGAFGALRPEDAEMQWDEEVRLRRHAAQILPACVSYVEMRRPGPGESQVYFSAGLDRRFRERQFTDFFQLYMEGKPLDRNVNLHKGVNWVVWRQSAGTEPGEAAKGVGLMKFGENIGRTGAELESGMDAGCTGKVESGRRKAGLDVRCLAGTCVVADSPAIDDLMTYDLIVAVIDPLPSRIFAGAATYEKLQDMAMSGAPVLWVVNRDSAAVNHGELRRFLRLKDFVSIPLMDEKVFYESEYTCRLPAELLLAGRGKKAGGGREGSAAARDMGGAGKSAVHGKGAVTEKSAVHGKSAAAKSGGSGEENNTAAAAALRRLLEVIEERLQKRDGR